MDFNKIFLKKACPTSIGGQAVMEGIMMRGPERTAVAVRLPNGKIHIKTELNGKPSKWAKYPIIRGIFAFITSLIQGTKILMYSADVLEANWPEDDEEYKKDKIDEWMNKKFGEQGAWNIMIYFSVIVALIFTVVIFILLPTVAVNWLGKLISSSIIMNLIEGLLRILLFVLYMVAISKMADIKTLFQYHGAEHKCIHCYENGLELTPENAQTFYTLHPRCGTSFLMFVMVISLVVFSFLGWPNLILRITSRILLIPLIAGLSYELLKWAGRSDNWLVKILSIPGLYLQKLSTKTPTNLQLEVAIASMKAVLVPEGTECFEGICDLNGILIEATEIKRKEKASKEKTR